MKREQFRELLRQFVKKGIRMKYRNSVLGIIWSLFEPLLSIPVFLFGMGRTSAWILFPCHGIGVHHRIIWR